MLESPEGRTALIATGENVLQSFGRCDWRSIAYFGYVNQILVYGIGASTFRDIMSIANRLSRAKRSYTELSKAVVAMLVQLCRSNNYIRGSDNRRKIIK